MSKIKSCMKYLSIGCSLPQGSQTCYSDDFPCMADYLSYLPKFYRETFIEDARIEGYRMIGAEDLIWQLNHYNAIIKKSDHQEGTLKQLTQNNPIIPWAIAVAQDFQTKVDSYIHYHGRPSQFSSSKCPLSVLMSNLDQDKVQQTTDLEILEVRETIAGSIRHDIASAPTLRYLQTPLMHQHPAFWEYKTLRQDYTEKRVAYILSLDEITDNGLSEDLDNLFNFMKGGKLKGLEVWDMTTFQYERSHYKEWFESLDMNWREFGIKEYVFKGTADLIMTLANTGEIIIGDWKRARFQKNSFDLQTSLYALAIEQMASMFSPQYLLVLGINRFGNKTDDYNLPSLHIRLLERDDILTKTAKLKAVFLHTVMATLIDNPSHFLKLREQQRVIRPSKYKDHSEMMHCDDLFTGSTCINHRNNMCQAVSEFIQEGGDLNDLLIEGFQPWT